MRVEYRPDEEIGIIRRGQLQQLIKFQHGVVPDAGENGVFNEDVIALLIMRLSDLNQGEFRCRENSLAITKLEEALLWLHQRTRNRELQGVEGTLQPHAQLGGNDAGP